jgi:hypothetical protein
VSELAEALFEESTQLIVIIHDENPAFFHPAPIYRLVEERYRCATSPLDDYLYEILTRRVRNISERHEVITEYTGMDCEV